MRAQVLSNNSSNANRIIWVDVAKGITIILTIIGHTLDYGTLGRNIIFSFHMPLFFILSGYTFKTSDHWDNCLFRINKDIVRLLCPVLFVSAISLLLQYIFSLDHSGDRFIQLFYQMSFSLYWASGISVHEAPPLGMLWFLISLFTARTLFNILNLLFPKDKYRISSVLVGLLGIYLGMKHIYLPFNIDVSLVATLFLAIGYLLRNSLIIADNVSLKVLITAFWISCLYSGIYIELATRSYPGLLICIVEALAGTCIIIWISKLMVSTSLASNVLAPLGRITLTILCVHHLDAFLINFWGGAESIFVKCAYRLTIVLIVSIFIEFIKRPLKEKCFKTT